MRRVDSTYIFADRRSFVGGSDARIIMGEDQAALVRLWKEKRGEAEPEDLSGDLLVQLGTVTEPLNRHWYEKNTGQAITEVQRQAFHPVHRWMAATLDGRVEATGAVFEAKFMLPWNFSEEGAAEKHMAQLQHARTLETRSPMDTIMKIACVVLFVPAMWGVHVIAKQIAVNYGVVGGAIALVAIFATASLMDRR